MPRHLVRLAPLGNAELRMMREDGRQWILLLLQSLVKLSALPSLPDSCAVALSNLLELVVCVEPQEGTRHRPDKALPFLCHFRLPVPLQSLSPSSPISMLHSIHIAQCRGCQLAMLLLILF
jgi:hypothetical protein